MVPLTTQKQLPAATLHSVVDHMLIAFFGSLLLTTPPTNAKDDLQHTKNEVVDL